MTDVVWNSGHVSSMAASKGDALKEEPRTTKEMDREYKGKCGHKKHTIRESNGYCA